MLFTCEQPEGQARDPGELERIIGQAYEAGRARTQTGTVASYIPELAKADGREFGICARNLAGEMIAFGDTEKRFSIQSISKVLNLATALTFLGVRGTFAHVRMEPTGDAFNSILKLDTVSDLPFNPMINAGAIQVMSLLSNIIDFEQLLCFARAFCMDEQIQLNEAVYHSEAETGDRNRAIVYLLKSKGVLQGDPDKTVDLYFRMCSLNVNARSLANMGLLLANGGVNPFTGQRMIQTDHVRILRSLMLTCGLYDESGAYGVWVGIPSKSGVGGGIMGSVTRQWGIGTYGPALNEKGNSAGGIAALRYMSQALGLNIFA